MGTIPGYHNVKDYRDPGDPDWTAAIGRAELACEAAGGGVVYFPAGNYTVSGTTTIAASGVRWLGVGAAASIIQYVANPGGGAVFIVETDSTQSINFTTICKLGFTGTGALGGTLADAVIAFNGGICNKVINCEFTNNQGPSVYFGTATETSATDGEIFGCRFSNVGYNPNDVATPTRDAVIADATSSGIRIHDNHLDTCGIGGIRLLGNFCDVSSNFVTKATGYGIFSGKSNLGSRIGLNSVDRSVTLQGTSAGINPGLGSYFCVIGNTVLLSQGDGIAINGWASGAVLGNNSGDNCTLSGTGDCGIQFIAQSGASDYNQCIVVVGNNSFDDRGENAKQPYGIHMLTDNVAVAVNSAILANNTYGNLTQGILEEKKCMSDDTNSIIGNSDWLERLHTVMPVTINSPTYTALQQQSISADSMRERCGIKISSGGSTLGTNNKKHFELVLGTFTIFTYDTTSSAAGDWELVVFILNNTASTSSQAAMSLLYYNGALAKTWETTLGVDTTVAQTLTLSGKLSNSSDSITCDYFTVERC